LLPRRAIPAYEKLRPLGFPLVFLVLVVIPWIFPDVRIAQWLLQVPAEWAEARYVGIANWIAQNI
jgi:hypothetical protein